MARDTSTVKCAVCGRETPSSIIEPGHEHSAKVTEGWIDFGGYDELLIGLPYPETSTLPFELVDAIREFEGLVRIEADPQISAPDIVQAKAAMRARFARPATGIPSERSGITRIGCCS